MGKSAASSEQSGLCCAVAGSLMRELELDSLCIFRAKWRDLQMYRCLPYVIARTSMLAAMSFAADAPSLDCGAMMVRGHGQLARWFAELQHRPAAPLPTVAAYSFG